MTEEQIKMEARFMALERFACHSHNIALRAISILTSTSAGEINEIERQSLEQMRLVPVHGMPAHLSDVLSDETFRGLELLVMQARALRSLAKG